jgi:hypothetical protein
LSSNSIPGPCSGKRRCTNERFYRSDANQCRTYSLQVKSSASADADC